MSKRSAWSSRVGFILAAAGSAIGLGNIWRFPYIVGNHGGGAFIAVYLLFLLLVGLPVFVAEVLIGRTAQLSPAGAFKQLGRGSLWQVGGQMTIFTGFIISAFYSVIAGWIMGYLVESIKGEVSILTTTRAAVNHFDTLVSHPWWAVGYHTLFMMAATYILYGGVRRGIEKANRVMVPMLFIMLFLFLIYGLLQPGGIRGFWFLVTPDWSVLTPAALVTALGHAFFTLSLGQGTMITYGSYIKGKDNLIGITLIPTIMDTVVSLLAALVIFSIVFSANIPPASGPGLFFHSLPMVFSQTFAGQWIAILFFTLVLLAAITSEISALEPGIAYLMDRWNWPRHQAVLICCAGAYLLGVPCALATGPLSHIQIGGMNILDAVSNFASDCLIPLGGLAAALLVGWRWGTRYSIPALRQGAEETFDKHPWLTWYFWFCFKIGAPTLILIVLLDALGVFR
jgi:NSS family neurotransmitter:Na+ symporter